MAKSREHVVTNGRAVFYASMWDDLRQAALDCGWALALHGSLANDMDIMAMPWTEDAKPIEVLLDAMCSCFTDNEDLRKDVFETNDKPHGRTVYTFPIFADFYIDLSVGGKMG